MDQRGCGRRLGLLGRSAIMVIINDPVFEVNERIPGYELW